MTTPISTSAIDSAYSAAIVAAQALGNSVTRIAPVAVAGEEGQTVQTDTITYKGSKGFRVTAAIQIGGYRATRVHETLPVLKETAWPSDIAGEAEKWKLDSITAGKDFITRSGFDAVDLVAMLNMFITALTAAGGDPATLATAKPKLVAAYSWSQTVQATAAAGGRMFPKSPFTFAEVFAEFHTS